MTLQTFRELMTQRPFKPFRFVMSSGQTYDVRHPGLILPTGVEGSALIPAAGDASYPIGMNVANYIQNGSRGLLLLQMHNEANAQAEVVDLPFTWPYKRFLPIVGHQRQ